MQSQTSRTCKWCGSLHPLFYKVYGNGFKHMAYACPATGKTSMQPIQNGLDIPTLYSKNYVKKLENGVAPAIEPIRKETTPNSQRFMSYAEKLQDPRWQKRRLKIMERDGWKCRICERGDLTLNVHHVFYEKGKAPWEYEDAALKTLCRPCHNAITENLNAVSVLISEPDWFDWFDWLVGCILNGQETTIATELRKYQKDRAHLEFPPEQVS